MIKNRILILYKDSKSGENHFFTIIVENGIDISEDTMKVLIENALKNRVNRSHNFFVIAFLNKSSHMFEDHLANGFIGINRAIEEISNTKVRNILLQVGLYHELSHEITGESGREFEKEQLRKDCLEFDEAREGKHRRIGQRNKIYFCTLCFWIWKSAVYKSNKKRGRRNQETVKSY